MPYNSKTSRNFDKGFGETILNIDNLRLSENGSCGLKIMENHGDLPFYKKIKIKAEGYRHIFLCVLKYIYMYFVSNKIF